MDKQISFYLLKLKLEVELPHSHMSSYDGYKPGLAPLLSHDAS